MVSDPTPIRLASEAGGTKALAMNCGVAEQGVTIGYFVPYSHSMYLKTILAAAASDPSALNPATEDYSPIFTAAD